MTDPGLAAEILEALHAIDASDRNRDIFGDVYEYMVSKLSSAGHFGQFRTPRHIIQFLVEALQPRAGDTILDPACGTAGFLLAANEHIRRESPGLAARYIGEEIDSNIAMIARTNMRLHGVVDALIAQTDGLKNRDKADIILANPPFAGSVSAGRAAEFSVNSSRTELLFLEMMMDRLQDGGRAGVVVPFSVLTNSGSAASFIRGRLLDGNRLEAVIELPAGVFRPYTDVRTGLLIWRGGGTTETVIMARARTDGYTLDDRRLPIAESDLPRILESVAQRSPAPNLSIRVNADAIRDDDLNLSPTRHLPDAATLHGPVISATEAVANLEQCLGRLGSTLSMMRERV